MSLLFAGLISGTSLDSLDAALTRIDGDSLQVLQTHSHPIPNTLRQQMLELCLPGDNEIDQLGQTEIDFAMLCSEAVSDLLAAAGISAGDVTAIGSHGQTVRHRPPAAGGAAGFTLQLGDPNTLAALTGIDTVADFRRADMALGGQGAPLASGFHRFAFSKTGENRAVINIGGMSNITTMSANGAISGCDTGPGNVLMDIWIQSQRGHAYDAGGAWAASGTVIGELLATLMDDAYFRLTGPKSTGREAFNADYLHQKTAQHRRADATDIQATLLEFTARTIAGGLGDSEQLDSIYICGGGAHNTALMQRLQQLAPDCNVTTTSALGIDPDWVEAAAFAWLAYCRVNNLAGNVPEVTGASRKAILGGIYSGSLPSSERS